MEALRNESIGNILERLLADRLIDACHMTIDYVTIVQGTKRYSFALRKARTFLLGMLRGRSWNPERPSDASTRDVSTLRAVDTMRAIEVSGTEPFEPALDGLLHIATYMRIIEGHERDPGAGSVTISLSACETEMRENEAIAFLAECILHKLEELLRLPALTHVASGWDRGDGAWTDAVERPSAE